MAFEDVPVDPFVARIPSETFYLGWRTKVPPRDLYASTDQPPAGSDLECLEAAVGQRTPVRLAIGQVLARNGNMISPADLEQVVRDVQGVPDAHVVRVHASLNDVGQPCHSIFYTTGGQIS